MKKIIFMYIICGLLSSLQISCSTLPVEESAEKHRAKGMEHFEQSKKFNIIGYGDQTRKKESELCSAMDELNKAIKIHPNFARAYYNRGIVINKIRSESNHYLPCIKEYANSDPLLDIQKALDIDPNFIEANDAIVFLARNGYIDKALIYANRAIEIDNNQETIKIRDKLLNDRKSAERGAKLNKIKKVALQGERNGFRVELDISGLYPYAWYPCGSGYGFKMAIYSNRDVTLNGFADKLLLSLDGKMCQTDLISCTWLNYPESMLKNTRAEFYVRSDYTCNHSDYEDFLREIKKMIVDHMEDPKKFPMSKINAYVSKRVQCQYKIGSLSLTIPLNKVIFEYDK